jgi:hypothetical protein
VTKFAIPIIGLMLVATLAQAAGMRGYTRQETVVGGGLVAGSMVEVWFDFSELAPAACVVSDGEAYYEIGFDMQTALQKCCLLAYKTMNDGSLWASDTNEYEIGSGDWVDIDITLTDRSAASPGD